MLVAIANHSDSDAEYHGSASWESVREASSLEEGPDRIKEPRQDVEAHFAYFGLRLNQSRKRADNRAENNHPRTICQSYDPQPNA